VIKAEDSKKGFLNLLNYIPGLVILIFGMLALHSSVSLIEERKAYVSENLEFSKQSPEVDRSAQNSLFVRIQNIEKKERWLYWSVLLMGLSGFVLIVLNTDKLKKLKQANEEKKDSLVLLENRLAAMEATRDGIGLIDGEGNLTYMNPALMSLHDILVENFDQYIGRPWEQLYMHKDPEVQEARLNIQRKVMPELRKNGYWQGETPIARKGDEIVNAELSLTLLPDGGFIGTVRDLSERIKTDKEKKELESQFYQAQKMEAIGRLAGGIAHDFNNILAAMNGYAEFLTDDLEEGSPQHKFALNILQAGRQARDLVDQMLAFSRRKQSTKETLDIIVPVHETLSMLKATLPKTIEVETQIDVSHAPIDGNANQIAQVIMNLCVNAKDAIEDDHGVLRLGLNIIRSDEYDFPEPLVDALPEASVVPPVKIDEPGPASTRLVLGQLVRDRKYVCLSVEDTGCGMSKLIMEHIFEPFFTTKPVDKGTGLGLATVHGVVTGHQGAMTIHSELQKGTRFDILFPMAEEDIEEKPVDREEELLQQGSGNILLVEDQDSVRDMMISMLERLGYKAESCASGLEALDFLRENPDQFDLVITDHNMPKMTGLELVQQIHIDMPDLPFILLSGYSQEKMKALMQDHPAIKEILRKPVSKQVLSHKIQAVLSRKRKAA